MDRKISVWLTAFLLTSLILFPVSASSHNPGPSSAKINLNIATVDNRPLSIDRLLYTAFDDIGYRVTMTTAASLQQGYTLADGGERDGVISSTPDMEAAYPHLRKVPVALDTNSPTAFLRADSNLKINEWGDLSGLKVGILTQRVYIQNSIPSDARIIAKENTSLVFDALADGEVDVVVLTVRGHETINLPEGIICGEPVETLNEYLYLHERRAAHLVPDIAESLQKMFEDGRGEKILNDIPITETNKKTVIHMYSSSSELAREEVFTEKLRRQFENDESFEWYTIALNSRRFSIDPNRIVSFANLLRQDCVSRDIAAIIVSGDDALDFIKDYYFLFFRNVPVLFYGVGDYYSTAISGFEPYFTGIPEKLSAFETVDAALGLFPDTQNLYVLNDYTVEGQNYKTAIGNQLKPLEGIINIEYSENAGRDELLSRISKLPQDSVVLVGSYFRDANGQYFSQNDMKRVLELNCKVPIVALYSTNLPYYSIGGKCLDYEKCGEVTADMLRRLLNGEPVKNIPVVPDSGSYNRWVFDKVMLDKMGINEKALPRGAQIINKNPSVWEVNPEFAFSMIILLIISVAIVVLTQIYRHREKIMRIKLRETAMAAEEASRMKSAFLANMSHEIRTPMNGIIGFSELALDDNISPRTKDYLSKIRASADGLLDIINDILDISKIEAGKIYLENIPFELHEVFRICQIIITPKALEKGILMFCYAEPAINKRLLGDPTRLRQVLLNLLSNAVKFTNTGVVKLMADVVQERDDSLTIHIEVKDSGIGMTAEQISRVFTPFMQADDSTTRKYGGTGLGLSITKNIIELMGGELKVESTPGLGSKFSFDLTFKVLDSIPETGEYRLPANVVEKPAFSGHVLVCEDNAMSQQVICDHLSRVGLTATVAINGLEGVDLVRRRIENDEKPFDLIFMDIHMPVMDGLEATKALVRIGNRTPVIALTANIMHSDKESYRTHGMLDCMAKPFKAQDLWICLLKHLTPLSVTAVNNTEQARADEKLRERLLTNFSKDNRNTFDDINNAVNAGDIKLAHRLAHTLKGVAGLIGNAGLQEAARVIESSLEDGKSEFTPKQMSTLKLELDNALSGIAAQINGLKTKTSTPEAMEKEEAIKLLYELDLRLKANNFDCLDLVDALTAIPGSELLIAQIEDFDFAQARETLAGIKLALEV